MPTGPAICLPLTGREAGHELGLAASMLLGRNDEGPKIDDLEERTMSKPALVPELAARLGRLSDVRSLEDGPPRPQDIAAFQAFSAPVEGYALPEVAVSDATVPGPHGEIPVRIYQPTQGPVSGGLLWAHGGAFMFGDLDMPESDAVARELVDRASMAVVAVDYRLCGDGVHFPVPHDDVHAAFRWAATESGLVPDGGSWALGGASAGGNLATGVAQRLRDEGGVEPDSLVLAYPVLHHDLPDCSEEQLARVSSLPPALAFSPSARAMINRNFLGDNGPGVNYAFPALGDVAGLPRSFISVGDHDDLEPSGRAFANQLNAAGVPAEVEFVTGVNHGHLNVAGLAETFRTIDAMASFMAADS